CSRAAPAVDPALRDWPERLPLSGTRSVSYWSQEGRGRTELLARVIAALDRHRWGKVPDSGWADWDLAVYCYPHTLVQVCTAEEEHDGGARLIRVRYRLSRGEWLRALAGLGAVAGAAALTAGPWAAPACTGVALAAR